MAQELSPDEIYNIAEEVVMWAVEQQREVKRHEAKAAIKSKIGPALYKKYSKQFKQALTTVAMKVNEKKSSDNEAEPEEEEEPEAEEFEEKMDEDKGEDDEDDDYEEKPKPKRKPKAKAKTKRKRRLKKSAANDDSDEEPKAKKRRKRKEDRPVQYPDNVVGEPPKKPQSSYFLFARDNREKVKAENPTAKQPDLSKILGQMWKEITAAEKKVYEEKAKEAKKEYEVAIEEFKKNNPDTWRAALSAKGKKRATGEKRTKTAASAPELDEDGQPIPKSAFDQILDSLKTARKPKDVGDVQETQRRCDEFVQLMESCAEVDRTNYRKGVPATSKLTLLNDVVAKCRKRLLQEYIMDSNVCRALAKWLEPLPDRRYRHGVLPNKTLRETLYGLLAEMNIDADRLEASAYQYTVGSRAVNMNLGKVINMLFQHPDETVANKNKLRSLIEKWIRPLTDASNNYEDLKEVEFNNIRENKQRRSALMKMRVPAYIANNPIPQPATFDYAVRPQSKVQVPSGSRSKSGNDMRSRMIKKIKSKSTGKK